MLITVETWKNRTNPVQTRGSKDEISGENPNSIQQSNDVERGLQNYGSTRIYRIYHFHQHGCLTMIYIYNIYIYIYIYDVYFAHTSKRKEVQGGAPPVVS